jgi:hypothetical protein
MPPTLRRFSSHTTPPPARAIQLRESRRRLARLSKPDLIEKLLEFRNAYAVVSGVAASERRKVCKKVEQKIANTQST